MNDTDEIDYSPYSRSEILNTFIDDLVEAGINSKDIGHALADIWLALPEEIE